MLFNTKAVFDLRNLTETGFGSNRFIHSKMQIQNRFRETIETIPEDGFVAKPEALTFVYVVEAGWMNYKICIYFIILIIFWTNDGNYYTYNERWRLKHFGRQWQLEERAVVRRLGGAGVSRTGRPKCDYERHKRNITLLQRTHYTINLLFSKTGGASSSSSNRNWRSHVYFFPLVCWFQHNWTLLLDSIALKFFFLSMHLYYMLFCVVLRVRNKYYYIIMLSCLHPVTMQLGSVHFFCHLESETGFRLKSETSFVNQIRPKGK